MARRPGARLIVTYGSQAASEHPTRHNCTWPELLAWLQSSPPALGAKDGPWLCFADFGTEPRMTAGTSDRAPRMATGVRAYTHLIASHAVPLDLDLGQYVWTPADIAARLTGLSYAAWTSYSHSPENPRWRIVVPVARPMSREEHYATWETLAALFAHDCGPSSKDATRLNYLPGACLHPEHAQFITGDGALFPVSVPTGTERTPVTDDLTDAPVDGYSGPTDDDTLIKFMLASRTRLEDAFGTGPTRFEALWTADAAALAIKFPPIEDDQLFEHTRADAGLANELAYYTGGHGTRCLELFMRSALADRPKFREDKARRAVMLACLGRTQYAFIRPGARSETPPETTGTVAAKTPTPSAPDAPQPEAGDPQAGDFFAYLPQHDYIHRPTGMHWPAASLDGTVGKDTRMMLDLTHPVHLLSWAPGLPERFQWRDLDDTRPAAADSWTYNRYQAPRRPRRSGAQIDPWLKLLNALYPTDAGHILKYFADAVQNPGRKCNHALVLGSGVHGIGKDTLLRPLKWAVGEHNYATISPSEIFDKNNAWAESVVVQISETRNVGDGQGDRISKYDMYERCKDLAAAPPTTLSCQDKWVARHQVRNVLRPIYTTNHGVDGIYIPLQDRRTYAAWSDALAMSEADALALHKWLDAGGCEEVAAFLYDPSHLDGWNPGARPPQTAWWWRLVRESEGDENPLTEALERMGNPAWVTAEQLSKEGGPAVTSWFADVRNRKHASKHLAALGYRRVENPADKRGRFNIGQIRAVVYGKPEITAESIIPVGRGR